MQAGRLNPVREVDVHHTGPRPLEPEIAESEETASNSRGRNNPAIPGLKCAVLPPYFRGDVYRCDDPLAPAKLLLQKIRGVRTKQSSPSARGRKCSRLRRAIGGLQE
jgi:hypothetical protein